MNRPLEFRVWTGTKMEYNIVAGRDGVFYAKINPRDSACLEPTSRYELDTPVMQFTGFRDAFGGKIFEGDVVQYTWFTIKAGYSPKGVVIYNGGFFVEVGLYSFPLNSYIHNPNLEIIGNIHQNPTLLCDIKKEIDNTIKPANLEKITMPELIESILWDNKDLKP